MYMAKKKEVTIDDLANIVKEGFAEADKRTDKKIDDLAMMAQKGFLGMEEKFVKIEKGQKELKADIGEIKKDIKDVKVDLNKRVDIFTHKGLEFRVEKLEEKLA